MATEGLHIDRNDADPSDPRIAELARELAAAINRADPAGRTDMRNLAIEVIRESVEPEGAMEPAEEAAPGAAATLNPFALGIPLLLVGGSLTFLFPPVGLLLLALGFAACLAGLALAIGRSLSARWRAGRTAR